MKKILLILFVSSLIFISMTTQQKEISKVRGLADTVGFAHTASQMDAVMKRIEEKFVAERKKTFSEKNIPEQIAWYLAICPHDDYTYSGDVYTYALKNIKAKTVLLFGVAHKAKNLKLENQIIFDSYPHWHGCYGNIKVSSAREEIMNELPKEIFQVNYTMQHIEHSVEAIVPFLQYYNRKVEIISILVPYMNYERMNEIAKPLANAIEKVLAKHKWQRGNDFAMVISTDCVHYGDEDWGGRNYARYGCDSTGYKKATEFEHQLINECLVGNPSLEKIKTFTQNTVQENDFREYKWTWCGRYSVPFGLLTSYYLSQLQKKNLDGILLRYATSIDHPHIPVDDLKMGITAKATLHHWVGYTAIGYR